MEYRQMIRELRERMIVSQKELADFLGVNFTTISRWENGKCEPTIKTKRKIAALCKKYNIPIRK